MVSTTSRSEHGTLFGQPIAEPLHQLIGRYPFPARLNEHHIRRFRTSSHAIWVDKGTVLFREGDLPRGVYIVLARRVKKSITSAQGRTLVVGFYDPGSVVGLEASVLGRAHVVTAETVHRAAVLLVSRRELIAEMRTNATAACQIAQLLAEDSCFVMGKLGTIELSESAPQAIARCVLALNSRSTKPEGQPVEADVSQETIAQMAGLARETVTRQLGRLRKAGVLKWNRTGFVIWDREALEKLAELPHAAA